MFPSFLSAPRLLIQVVERGPPSPLHAPWLPTAHLVDVGWHRMHTLNFPVRHSSLVDLQLSRHPLRTFQQYTFPLHPRSRSAKLLCALHARLDGLHRRNVYLNLGLLLRQILVARLRCLGWLPGSKHCQSEPTGARKSCSGTNRISSNR